MITRLRLFEFGLGLRKPFMSNYDSRMYGRRDPDSIEEFSSTGEPASGAKLYASDDLCAHRHTVRERIEQILSTGVSELKPVSKLKVE